jgi:lysozyme
MWKNIFGPRPKEIVEKPKQKEIVEKPRQEVAEKPKQKEISEPQRYGKEIVDHFIREEGYSEKSYLDTKGNWTIGIGHLLGVGSSFSDMRWTRAKIISVFENDLDSAYADAKIIFPQFMSFSYNVQLAILDMIFNMGAVRFRGFKKSIRLINEGRFKEAAVEILDSKWAKVDVPNRAIRVSNLMKKG